MPPGHRGGGTVAPHARGHTACRWEFPEIRRPRLGTATISILACWGLDWRSILGSSHIQHVHGHVVHSCYIPRESLGSLSSGLVRRKTIPFMNRLGSPTIVSTWSHSSRSLLWLLRLHEQLFFCRWFLG